VENISPTGIRSPDRLACSQSLYRLLYPSPHDAAVNSFFFRWKVIIGSSTHSLINCRRMNKMTVEMSSFQNAHECDIRFETCSSAEKHRRPVCGTDNQTYASRCHLLREHCRGSQVVIQHRGKCTGNDL